MTERLPGGGNAWFVRYRRGMSYQLTPCAKEGWLVIAGFVAVNMLAVLLLLPKPTLVRWAAWGTIEIVATALLIIVAFRTSAPGWRDR